MTMFRKALSIVLIACIASCTTLPTWAPGHVPQESSEYLEPNPVSGCSHLKGWNRQKCIEEYSVLVEDAYNKATEETLKEDRDGDYVNRLLKICFGEICHLRKDRIYDPTLESRLIKYGLVVIVVGGVAYVGGFSAAQMAPALIP
jgi:hypothetical protein